MESEGSFSERPDTADLGDQSVPDRVLQGLRENLSRIRRQIRQSAERAGRRAEEVWLLPATKYADITIMRGLAAVGLRQFGENQVQAAARKAAVLGEEIAFHMIGHLQRNKVKRALEVFRSVQSVDSLRLAREISKRAGDREVPVLLEVNVGGEEQKYGFAPAELIEALKEISKLPHLRVEGLMTMPPWREDPEQVRPYFRQLRELRDEVRASGHGTLQVLSMGMSHDFTVAIEEGSTCVRIGSALFAGLSSPETP